jgi:integrase
MARTLRDSKLDTREARARLKVRGKPYWRLIEPGLHLGYRRLAGKPGTWCLRRYVGQQAYAVETLGAAADDFGNADGRGVLSYAQAQRALLGRKAKVGATITVATAIERYLAHLADRGKPVDDTTYRVNALILPSLGGVEIGALIPEQIRAWLSALAKSAPRSGAAPDKLDAEARRRRQASANRTFTILRAALNLAFHDGHAPSDSAWRRVKAFRDVEVACVRYLTVAECQRLINASESPLRQLVQAGLQTGARYGELGRLEVRDFNPDVGTLNIRISKSGRSRHLVLTGEGQAFFARLCAGRDGRAPMLAGRWTDTGNLTKPMRQACERARIKPPVSFHALRHTWASLAVMNGVPLMVVAKNLGHADTRMVEKHYGHLAPSYIADAIRAGAPRFGIEPDTVVTPLAR